MSTLEIFLLFLCVKLAATSAFLLWQNQNYRKQIRYYLNAQRTAEPSSMIGIIAGIALAVLAVRAIRGGEEESGE